MGALVRSALVSPPARRAALALGRDRLTVVLYHRIGDAADPYFDGDPGMLSGTRAMFEEQVDFLNRHFSVISLADLARYVVAGTPLPDRPALITFDDGYLDNFTEAFPVLRRRGTPAVIFLATGFVGSDRRPWWDELAHLFGRTERTTADLPLCGVHRVGDAGERDAARTALSTRLKGIPHADVDGVIQATAAALDVPRPVDGPRRFVTWDEVRQMEADGISFEPHTHTHPILSRLPPAAGREEITTSSALVAERLGRPARAFAYPNGRPQDIDDVHRETLRGLSVPLAFTTTSGPVRLADVRARPLDIPRVMVSRKDVIDRFALKVLGFPRVGQRLRAR